MNALVARTRFARLTVAAIAGTLVLSGCAAALMGRAASSGTTQSSGAGSQRASGAASTTGSAQRAGSTATGSTQRAGSAPSSNGSSSRSAAQIEQDRQVAASVRSRLSADAGTKSLAVGVDAYQGVVSLHGEVANAGQRSAVERVTRSVAGVRDVRNELRER